VRDLLPNFSLFVLCSHQLADVAASLHLYIMIVEKYMSEEDKALKEAELEIPIVLPEPVEAVPSTHTQSYR
jgi:hypothetical protein